MAIQWFPGHMNVTKKAITERAYSIMANVIGNAAPALDLNTIDNKAFSLYKQAAKYTFIAKPNRNYEAIAVNADGIKETIAFKTNAAMNANIGGKVNSFRAIADTDAVPELYQTATQIPNVLNTKNDPG